MTAADAGYKTKMYFNLRPQFAIRVFSYTSLERLCVLKKDDSLIKYKREIIFRGKVIDFIEYTVTLLERASAALEFVRRYLLNTQLECSNS